MFSTPIIPVILCGGYGTRLWPLSRTDNPKQFLKLMDNKSMLYHTFARALECTQAIPEHVITVTLQEFEKQIYKELLQFGANATCHILREPVARNTTAAIAYAARYAEIHFGPQAILWVMPSDHVITDTEALKEALASGIRAAKDGYLATFGIEPDAPDTAFGYIKPGRALQRGRRAKRVEFFTEKPNREAADYYLQTRQYLWNSGMFVFRCETILEEIKTYVPAITHSMQYILSGHQNFHNPDLKLYQELPKVSFDVAVMEKTKKAAVIPCDLGWTDIGSWDRLARVVQVAQNDNPRNEAQQHSV